METHTETNQNKKTMPQHANRQFTADPLTCVGLLGTRTRRGRSKKKGKKKDARIFSTTHTKKSSILFYTTIYSSLQS